MDTQITNGTMPVDIVIQDPITGFATSILIPLISIIAIASISLLTWRHTKQQNERSGLMTVFEMLNHADHKGCEHQLIEGLRGGSLYDDNKNIAQPYEEFANTVRRDYDLAGVLIDRGLVPRHQYYLVFGVITVVYFVILKDAIMGKRKNGQPQFMAYFQNLAIDCFEFWSKHRKIFHPKTNEDITKEMMGDKVKLPKKEFSIFPQ